MIKFIIFADWSALAWHTMHGFVMSEADIVCDKLDSAMDIELFLEMLGMDSSSGKEKGFGDFLAGRLKTSHCVVERFPLSGYGVADIPEDEIPENLLFSWGNPHVVFCTHLDTVPPYVAPSVEKRDDGKVVVKGRGSCDAKGQIFAMYNACLELERRGHTGFGLLLLAGEEVGSLGAKSFRTCHPGGKYVIVGEPTDNRMVSASKGTKSFAVTVKGKSFHSGYPVYGASAVERFVDMMNSLRAVEFPVDPRLGDTTWNVGKLVSDNPQNILSDRLTFRIYFRTTFLSDGMVCDVMEGMRNEFVEVEAFGGDTPAEYMTLDGFGTKTVAFGSDAPQLTNFGCRMLYGPGSILVAHTASERIGLDDISKAVEDYVKMFEQLA